MANRLRFGILGTGNIARQFAEGVAGAHRSVVTAIASRTHEKANAFAEIYPIDRHYGSYDELLADDGVDAVYVSLPNSMHHQWTLKALAAGKHVLCEKPIASNTKEAEQMFAAAQKHDRVLMEAFMYRCHPQTFAALEKIKQGAIGELRLIRAAFCFRVRSTEGNIRFDAGLAGGALMDIGCYCISLARTVTGEEPIAMHGVGHLHQSGVSGVSGASGVDDYAVAVLKFPGGVVAELCCGMSVQTDNTATLCGSEGYLELPWPWKPSFPVSTYAIKSQVPPRQDAVKGKRRAHEEVQVEVDRPLYGLEADAFADVVLTGAPIPVSKEHSIGNMRVLDELRRQIGVTM